MFCWLGIHIWKYFSHNFQDHRKCRHCPKHQVYYAFSDWTDTDEAAPDEG